MDLIDEDNDVPACADLFEDLLEAFFEVTTVARASDERTHVEAVNLLVLDGFRNITMNDGLCEPLNDGGLTNAGLTNQNRVVLGAP